MSRFQPAGQQLLTIDDLPVVREALNKVRAKWYDVGMQLRVSVDTLDAIKKQCLNDPSDCLRETLMTWLKSYPPSPTWNDAVDALRSSVISESKLAADLEHKYCQNTSDPSLTSDLISTPLCISKAAGIATPPTIHQAGSQPPQLTPGPTPSTSPQYTEQQHPPPSLISDHPTPPDPEMPATTQLATVTTPPHNSAQENTGMN